MNKQEKLRKLLASGLVAVIRRPNEDNVYEIVDALVSGGVEALEITVDTPDVYNIIKTIKAKYSTKVLVGAGTVLDSITAKNAIEAGADFVFSPNMDQETIQVTNSYGRISIPGCLTPSEIINAYKSGADLIKIFPGGVLGIDYIKDLQGPIGYIPMMPTGGVNLENVGAFISNGAVAVGVGGSLVNASATSKDEFEEMTKKAKKFMKIIRQTKEEEVDG